MANILIIGDIILDHYVLGSVTRISPEAPIPVMDFKEDFYRLGGAANVANNLNNSKNRVTLFGVGGLKFLKIFEDLTKNRKFERHLDLTNHSFMVKTRYAANNNHYLLRVDNFEKYDSSFINFSKLNSFLAESDIILVSDYCKGTITDEVIREINKYKFKKKVLVDSKNPSKTSPLYANSYLITPNSKELKTLLGTLDPKVIKEYMFFYNIKNILHTKAEEGMDLYSMGPDNNFINVDHYSVTKQQVYDVTGAGDTVIAVIADYLASGMPIKSAIEKANGLAGIVIQKFGTATPED